MVGDYLVAVTNMISVAAPTLPWSIPRCSTTVVVPSGRVVVVMVDTQEARLSMARMAIVFMVWYYAQKMLGTSSEIGLGVPEEDAQ